MYVYTLDRDASCIDSTMSGRKSLPCSDDARRRLADVLRRAEERVRDERARKEGAAISPPPPPSASH